MRCSFWNMQRTVSHALSWCAVMLSPALAGAATDPGYSRSNLVADLPNVAAVTDTNLVNAWGLAVGWEGVLVVAANETSLTTFFRPDGMPVGDTINVPSAPTGLTLNRPSNGFRIMDGRRSRPSLLLFVTEEGKILGWNPQVNAGMAIVAVDNSAAGAVYKGVALARGRRGVRLYATDFHNGMVHVYDHNWRRVGTFTDPQVDAGFAPFNVANVDGLLVVTFAKQETPELKDDEAGPGNGFVDVFDTDGHLLRRFASHGPLNSPWGVALAPRNFGRFSNALLVGNFGDGHINAFNPHTGDVLGPLSDAQGNPLVIDGLWALAFGGDLRRGGDGDDMDEDRDNDRDGGREHGASESVLFFTAGPAHEDHGLVGRIVANPAP